MIHLPGRAALYGALLLASTVLLEAHVTIAPGAVPANSSQRFVVRVPSERPEATVKLRLELPPGMGAPRFLPKPPWTYELEKDASGKVTAVTWSGGEIGPQEFDEFVFTARVPATPGPLAFKSEQTYKSGTVVAWSGPPGDKAPAPVVDVKDSTFAMAADGQAAPTGATVRADAPAPSTPSGDRTGQIALALSVAAVLLSLTALRRRT
jgi:uncharacterized protein YcnI